MTWDDMGRMEDMKEMPDMKHIFLNVTTVEQCKYVGIYSWASNKNTVHEKFQRQIALVILKKAVR